MSPARTSPAEAGKAPVAPPRALWRDLLVRLLPPLLLIVAATGALGVYTARSLLDYTFDRWLIDAARSLALQVHFVEGRAVVDLGNDAQAILSYDAVDSTYFSVLQEGRHVAGHPGLPNHGLQATRYDDAEVFDAQFAGRPVRVAAVNAAKGTNRVRVLVAETLNKRRGVRTELLAMLLPLGGLLVAAGVAVVLALRWTIRPLESIAQRWNERSHRSLQTIDPQGVPRELLPFARALNDLLERIHGVLLRERQFAANAAHQIRTPLAGLQLGLSRAAAAPDLASARQVIGELQATTQRTARVVQQLLLLGRLDPEAAFDLDTAPIDLAELAHDVGTLYLDAALARGTAIELVTPEVPVVAEVQRELIEEALGNLVDNALRYMPAGGTIEIRVQADPPTLRVLDSGPGLPPALRTAVLDRFVRGPDGGSDGSGLGLAIVQEIATLHQAVLQLEESPLGGLGVRLAFRAFTPPAGAAPG